MVQHMQSHNAVIKDSITTGGRVVSNEYMLDYKMRSIIIVHVHVYGNPQVLSHHVSCEPVRVIDCGDGASYMYNYN